MLFHLSIDADDPRRVAGVLAEIMGGKALPFPAVIDGSWVALAGDARGTMIEVYPRGTQLIEGAGETGAYGVTGVPRRHSPVHMAIATEMELAQICAIASREGWTSKYCSRGGAFGVIELWIEGSLLVEVLTPEMQREYLDAISIENWERMLEEGARLDRAA